MDGFFNRKRCDRCGAPLDGGRTMSRFNTDTLCMKCAEEERHHPDYQLTNDIELAAVRAGDRNFAGLGCPARTGGASDENDGSAAPAANFAIFFAKFAAGI